MASFRVLDPFQTFFNQNSTAPAAGGRVDFFEAGTTTPKAVYAAPDLTVSNGDSITLDAAGRLSVDCWGSGAYRVRQYDDDGTIIKELDNIQPAGGASLQIPTPLVNGAFLTNDAAQLLWELIRQVPDPSGQNGKWLTSDGTSAGWGALPTPVITPGTSSLQIGKFLMQFGAAAAPNTGVPNSSVSVGFPTIYATILHVAVTPKGNGFTSDDKGVTVAVQENPAGFTVVFNTNQPGAPYINEPVTFTWCAFGYVP